MKTHQITVVVLENGERIGEHSLVYYDGQPYTVELRTPDGVDAVVANRAAGERVVEEATV